MTALALRGVSKSYRRITALRELSFSVPRGVICGLVGPNGAGKTTTFGVIGGLIQPDAGEVDLLGEGPFRVERHGGRVNLLPQDCALNPHTPVRDLLAYFARLQGMSADRARYETERVLEAVALTDRSSDRIRQLSHGMRRRVAVAQAFLGSPELILLDEPTSGLDPHLVVRMRELFRSVSGRTTLVISSHALGELERVCDHVIFIEEGACVRSGPIDAVTARGAQVRYMLGAPPDPSLITDLGFAGRSTGNTLTLTAPDGWTVAQLNARVLPALLAAGASVLEVHRGGSLEQAYMQTRQN